MFCEKKKLLIFFVEHSILDVWQCYHCASVISLFVKIEETNKIDLVEMYIQA